MADQEFNATQFAIQAIREDERRKVIAEARAIYERGPGHLLRSFETVASSLLAPEGEGGEHVHDWEPSSTWDTGSDPQRQRWDCSCGEEEWTADLDGPKVGPMPAPPSSEPARAGDDDWRTRRLHDLAESEPWRNPQALLARCLLYAEQERPPSGGLCADIEVVLGIAERPDAKREEGSTHG